MIVRLRRSRIADDVITHVPQFQYDVTVSLILQYIIMPDYTHVHDYTQRPTWLFTEKLCNDEMHMIGRWVVSPIGVMSYDGCMPMHILLRAISWTVPMLIDNITPAIGCIYDGEYFDVPIQMSTYIWEGMQFTDWLQHDGEISVSDGEPCECALYHIASFHTFDVI